MAVKMCDHRIATQRSFIGIGLCILGLALAGCGGASSHSSVGGADSGVTAADPTNAGAGASGSAESPRAGSTDVCALLSPADANAVARARGLSGTQTASTTYKLTVEKQTPGGVFPASACTFNIAEVTPDNMGAEARVGMLVQSAIHLDKTGTKVEGLGDEAYDNASSTQVRVGDLMLESTENSATEEFAVALYRVMIPHLR